VLIYIKLPLGCKKGLFFIQEMTLCNVQDAIRRTAVEERYQPQIGGLKKVKKPFGAARTS
jgi:hypothetical protein